MVSQCPPRLRVLTLQPYHWSRVPSQALRVHELKMSDVRGWSMLCDNPVSMLAVYLPEEDRCMDVLELIENEELLQYVAVLYAEQFHKPNHIRTLLCICHASSRFHARTLALYSSICSHGNHKVAHALVNHVDQKQLLFAIQSPCKPRIRSRCFPQFTGRWNKRRVNHFHHRLIWSITTSVPRPLGGPPFGFPRQSHVQHPR